MQGRVQQLYVVQCPGVAQQSIADGQCAALPRDCTQATQSLAAVFAAISSPTTTLPTTLPPTVKEYYPISETMHKIIGPHLF